jgi:hypothetical protein
VFEEPMTPARLEQWRRSIAMLTPRQPAGLDREAAMALMEELQRLQGADRRLAELVQAIRALLAAAERPTS